MGIFSSSEKVVCGRCEREYKLKHIRHVDGKEYCKQCSEKVIKRKEKERQQIKASDIDHIIVSTTGSLQGLEIEEYIDPITTQVVMGVNAWRDLLGSWGSFWGGRSRTLERELASGYDLALEDLKKEAYLRGAHAVIGVEFDGGMEMAGESDKSNDKMMVVSGMGTAVKLKGFEEVKVKSSRSCPECGSEMEENVAFCTSCGTEVE